MRKQILNTLVVFFVITLFFQIQVKAQRFGKQEIGVLIKKINDKINQHYILSSKKSTIIKELNQRLESGKYDTITNTDDLAIVLSKDLKAISQDGHLYVKHLQQHKNQEDLASWESDELVRETRDNYGFKEIQIIDGNIGFLKITEFMHPKRSINTAVAAMKLVENTTALIVDLRGNGGGYSGIMEYILNHYFDGPPTLLSTTKYSGSPHATTYTSDIIVGKLMIGKPLYVLIDKKTASAAEYFAYTLQARKKATIIGESSAGAANNNDYFELPYNFRISISTAIPIDAITNTNWENIGVKPDIEVDSQKAKVKALEIIKLDTETK